MILQRMNFVVKASFILLLTTQVLCPKVRVPGFDEINKKLSQAIDNPALKQQLLLIKALFYKNLSVDDLQREFKIIELLNKIETLPSNKITEVEKISTEILKPLLEYLQEYRDNIESPNTVKNGMFANSLNKMDAIEIRYILAERLKITIPHEKNPKTDSKKNKNGFTAREIEFLDSGASLNPRFSNEDKTNLLLKAMNHLEDDIVKDILKDFIKDVRNLIMLIEQFEDAVTQS